MTLPAATISVMSLVSTSVSILASPALYTVWSNEATVPATIVMNATNPGGGGGGRAGISGGGGEGEGMGDRELEPLAEAKMTISTTTSDPTSNPTTGATTSWKRHPFSYHAFDLTTVSDWSLSSSLFVILVNVRDRERLI